MIRILIGNKDIQAELKNFHFLENNNEYEIITSNSGKETINMCKTINPAIIIINSNFIDMEYTEVIDKLSNLPNENEKCNLILTVNNPDDKKLLSNTSIIYKIYDVPFDEKNKENIKDTINVLKNKFKLPHLDYKELRTILLNLGINIYSKGSQYLVSVIFKCYYYPEKFTTLDNIYKIVADEANTTKERIKDSIRHTIDTFNNLYNINSNSQYFKIFGDSKNISAKVFIQKLVNYLYTIKSKN